MFIIAAASVAIIGDKFSTRHMFLSSNLGQGYIVLLTTKTAGAQYAGVHLAVTGVYTGDALLLRWTPIMLLTVPPRGMANEQSVSQERMSQRRRNVQSP